MILPRSACILLCTTRTKSQIIISKLSKIVSPKRVWRNKLNREVSADNVGSRGWYQYLPVSWINWNWRIRSSAKLVNLPTLNHFLSGAEDRIYWAGCWAIEALFTVENCFYFKRIISVQIISAIFQRRQIIEKKESPTFRNIKRAGKNFQGLEDDPHATSAQR